MSNNLLMVNANGKFYHKLLMHPKSNKYSSDQCFKFLFEKLGSVCQPNVPLKSTS